MITVIPSPAPAAPLHSTFTVEDTILGSNEGDNQVFLLETELNANGKRPLQQVSPSPPPEKVFFSVHDLPSLRRTFELCRYHRIQVADVSKIHSNPALFHSGIRSYNFIRNQTYELLSGMCFINERRQPIPIVLNKDSFLTNYKRKVVQNFVEHKGNVVAFEQAVRQYAVQFQSNGFMDGSRSSYFKLLKDVFIADDQKIYQDEEARKVLARIAVDIVSAASPFLSPLKVEIDQWLGLKGVDKAGFYHQLYSIAAEKDAKISLDLSSPVIIFRFYQEAFAKIEVDPTINPEAIFVEMSSNILTSDIRLPEGKREYLALIQDVFVQDPLNRHDGHAYYAFIEMAVDEVIESSAYLNSLKNQVDLWLEANNVSDIDFYHHFYSQVAEKEGGLPFTLFNPQSIFLLYRRAFTTMQMHGDSKEKSEVDLEGVFFRMSSATLTTTYVPKGSDRDGLNALFNQSYQRLMTGSNYLQDKYQLLLNEFFGELDTIIAHVENTSKLIEENRENRGLFCAQFLELLKIRDSFLTLIETLKGDLDQLHHQRNRHGQASQAMSDFSDIGRAEFPYLCTGDSFILSREQPGALVAITLLEQYYYVYDVIHDANMLYFRKTITSVRHAILNLEKVIKKYNQLLYGQKEDSQKRICPDSKA